MKIKAAGNMVVVEQVKLDDITAVGDLFAATEKKQEMGRVVDDGGLTGDVSHFDPFTDRGIEVGDLLLYRKYGSTNFIVGGREYSIVGYADIVGRIGEI